MPRATMLLFLLAGLIACRDTAPTAPDSDLTVAKPSASLLSVTDPCTGVRVATTREIVFPSPEHRTLQSAVCAVSPGGTVHVLPGTHVERITIWGKHITIRGSGNEEEPTTWPELRVAVISEVVAARLAAGVITVAGGGSLSLSLLSVAGGDAGILVDETSGPVDVKHTAINFAQGGGIVAIASGVAINQVDVTFARYFGILLVNTFAHIEETSVDFTKAGPLAPNPNPVYGDAITLWSTTASWAQGGPMTSFALLKNNSTTFTDRVAFSTFGGSADLKGNTFSFQAIDIQVETFDGYVPHLTDLGGNQCFPSVGPGNPCLASSISIQTPPPVGRLE